MSGAVDLSVPDLAQLQARRSEKWAGHEPDVVASTVAEMDFPLATPVAEALRAAIGRADLGYAPSDIPVLSRAFSAFAERRFGWQVDPDQVLLVPDVMVGLVEVCRVLAGPDGTVAFMTPGYPPFFSEFSRSGLPTREIPLQADDTVDLDRLESELVQGVRVLVLVNPHNPTGRVRSRAELEHIAERCAEHDVWVVADEIHAPLVLPGAAHTPWLEVSEAARQRGIVLTSASKAFNLAGLKAALLVTASGPVHDVLQQLPPLATQAGLLGVIAAEAAFAAGDAWLDAVLAQLDTNRTLLQEYLATHLPAVKWTPPQGTYLAWLDCRRLGLGSDPAAHFLDHGRVALTPGLKYGSSGSGFVRLNFATSPDLLIETVTRMARSLALGNGAGQPR